MAETSFSLLLASDLESKALVSVRLATAVRSAAVAVARLAMASIVLSFGLT
jgi:hypothetical protein